MDKITLHLKADEQILTSAECPFKLASNTVSYVEAVFELGENWTGYDSVRAVWTTYLDTIATVLDSEGKCVVPHEVLTRTGKVSVNLVGSIVEDEELTDRLTTYPTVALNVNADAYVEGTETAPITPSQFEQYVADVAEEVAKIKDIESTTLNDDYTLTFVFSDGTSTTVGPIRGEQGPQGETGPQGPEGPPGEVTMAQFESAFPTDTASGAVASFPDGTDLFGAKSLVVEINPIQDLHGYDSPWVGGAGKNKLDLSKFTAGITAFGLTSAISGEYIAFSGTCSSGGSHAWRFMGTTDATTQALMATLSFKGFVISGTAPTIESIYWDSGNNQLSISVSGLVTNQSYNFTIGIVGYSDGTAPTQWTPYSNICPISGWDSVNAYVGSLDYGTNGITDDYRLNTDGTLESFVGQRVTDWIDVHEFSNIYGNIAPDAPSSAGHRFRLARYDENKNFIDLYERIELGPQKYIVPTNGAYYCRCSFAGTVYGTSHVYAIDTYTSTLPTTTYGGSVDIVKGVNGGSSELLKIVLSTLTFTYNSTRKYFSADLNPLPKVFDYNTLSRALSSGFKPITFYQIYNDLTIDCAFAVTNGTSDNAKVYIRNLAYTDATAFSNAFGSVELLYEKKTADTFSVTPTDVQILKATNNIFADSGNVSVTYKADTQLWVEKKLSE